MTVSINGSGGITYPDGSVNTTRSVSTAGDAMTGALTVTTSGPGFKSVGSNYAALSLKASGTGGREYVISSTDNTNGLGGGLLNIYDQTANANRFSLDASGIIRTYQSPQSAKFNIYSDGIAPLIYQNAGVNWSMRGKNVSSYLANQNANLFTINGAGGNMVVAAKVTVRGTSAVADSFGEAVGWAWVRYTSAGGYASSGIAQQITNTYGYGIGTYGSISWSQSGSNWTLRYTNSYTGYLHHTIDIDIQCRDSANITFDPSYVSNG